MFFVVQFVLSEYDSAVIYFLMADCLWQRKDPLLCAESPARPLMIAMAKTNEIILFSLLFLPLNYYGIGNVSYPGQYAK